LFFTEFIREDFTKAFSKDYFNWQISRTFISV
jgi:hypothetical protein